MKNVLIIPLLLLFLITGCSNSDDENNTPLEAQTLTDVPYGTDAQQKVDIYLPYNRNNDTKVIVILHGGSWVGGDKSDVASLIPILKIQFPDHAIVNMNYRLATETSPAYPKQTDDINSVLNHLKSNNYNISDKYAFIGFSAGAHLSLLYAYAYDTNHNVKAVCDVVGPADFTDPNYTSHPLYPSASQVLVGNSSPTPQQIETINPVSHITAQSPPTISFYGGQDRLVPATQGPRLKAGLDASNVYNEYNLYANGGHGDWDEATYAEVYTKMTLFLKNHF